MNIFGPREFKGGLKAQSTSVDNLTNMAPKGKIADRRDLWLIAIFLLLWVAAGSADYVSGRYGCFLIIPPALFPMFGSFIAAVIIVLRGFSSRYRGPILLQLVARIAFVWTIKELCMPFCAGFDSLYWVGRRLHVESVATKPVIDELRATVLRKLKTSGRSESLKILPEDLPRGLKESGWQVPHVNAGMQGGQVKVWVEWGNALTGHHGFVIAKDDSFFQKYLPHQYLPHERHTYPEKNGRHREACLPWIDGSYITLNND